MSSKDVVKVNIGDIMRIVTIPEGTRVFCPLGDRIRLGLMSFLHEGRESLINRQTPQYSLQLSERKTS